MKAEATNALNNFDGSIARYRIINSVKILNQIAQVSFSRSALDREIIFGYHYNITQILLLFNFRPQFARQFFEKIRIHIENLF